MTTSFQGLTNITGISENDIKERVWQRMPEGTYRREDITVEKLYNGTRKIYIRHTFDSDLDRGAQRIKALFWPSVGHTEDYSTIMDAGKFLTAVCGRDPLSREEHNEIKRNFLNMRRIYIYVPEIICEENRITIEISVDTRVETLKGVGNAVNGVGKIVFLIGAFSSIKL